MILQFSSRKIEVREEYLKSIISKSTEKEINCYKFDIKVTGKEKFEEFKKEIEKYKDEDLNELDSNGEIIRKFNIKKWSYRFFSEFDIEDTSYLCTLEIMQKEDLHINSIIIAGVENEVLQYKEEYDKYNNAIIIHTIVKSTEEQREKINKLIKNDDYFSVERPEINDKSIKMRFGKNIWSKHDGYIKRYLILVENKYDEKNKNRKTLFWPELKNIQNMLANNIAYTLELENLLMKKNIVNDKELSELKKNATERYNEVYREIYLVDNVEDEW